MKSRSDVVEGGGWITRTTTDRPRTRFFGFLTVVWLGVSLCASLPFWRGWPTTFGDLEWICGALLLLQGVFGILTFVFFFSEPQRTIREQRQNRDHDVGKLY